MDPPPAPVESTRARTDALLGGLILAFAGLIAAFVSELWGRVPLQPEVPLVDGQFLAPTPWRQTYADLVKAKEDLSDFDCYACHEKSQPPPIRFDARHRIVIPKEHENLRMAHGSHDRNNLCYNCHNEQDLLTLQTRDGRVIKFADASPLCGSCHGPTYRDWEAGVHGRTSGFWDPRLGERHRLQCANCHDPHSPPIPTRAPAPGPHRPAHPPGAKARPAH